MTFNVLQTSADGQPEPGYGTVVSPWSSRGPAVATLIHKYAPDVIGVQEAHLPVGTRRQVDSLVSYLNVSGDDYAVATTDLQRCGSCITGFPGGPYILWRTSTLRAGTTHGFFDLDNPGAGYTYTDRYAVYQELQSIKTGARFLFVSTHFTAGGASADARRTTEITNLFSQVGPVAARLGVPIVYGGDFNSNPVQHPVDSPNTQMRAHLFVDSRLASQHRYNEQYFSMNHYSRVPPSSTVHNYNIDYVYAGPGIGVGSWGIGLNTSGGQWVGTIPSDHNPVWTTLVISG
jgi:endonuclease/exonuclease/phosphatase family metal-dependent hydrolase